MLKVAVLCSRRAPGLDVVLANRGDYAVTCVITTHGAAVEGDVPVIHLPMRRPRRDFDASVLGVLDAFGADIVLLLGYTFIVTDVLLDAFPGRVLSIHDGDLRFKGLHATRDAILAGERETRSTLHLVTPEVDTGPIVAQSHPYPVAGFVREAAAAGHIDIVKAYAYAQREWMMRDCWGDLAVAALEGFLLEATA